MQMEPCGMLPCSWIVSFRSLLSRLPRVAVCPSSLPALQSGTALCDCASLLIHFPGFPALSKNNSHPFSCWWTLELFQVWGCEHSWTDLFVNMFSFLLSPYLEVELLGHRVVSYVYILWEIARLSTFPPTISESFSYYDVVVSVYVLTCMYFLTNHIGRGRFKKCLAHMCHLVLFKKHIVQNLAKPTLQRF